MAETAEAALGPNLSGIILTRAGHVRPGYQPAPGLELIEASHPVPDSAGMEAAERILALARSLGQRDRMICLLSGGGSSLMALPAPGVSLLDKQLITRALLASGAAIQEINCVRKHISSIKGGRLAMAAYPARIETYCISDVAGDDPALIASGPTLPDDTTLADARSVLERYSIHPSPAVTAALSDPDNETPRSDHPALSGAYGTVVARGRDALDSAASHLRRFGYEPVIIDELATGEARQAGCAHGRIAKGYLNKTAKYALISGGECTVKLETSQLTDRSGGGPNSEYLMALALELDGAPSIWAMAGDTDGIDGSCESAGAIISPTTLERAEAVGINFAEALKRHESYASFERLGDLVVTGPTLTNVNDLRIILIDRTTDDANAGTSS
jgi:hydroxypyruvate reductase